MNLKLPDEPILLSKPRRSWRRWLIVGVLVLIVATLIALFAVNRWYTANLQPREPGNTTGQPFIVRPGLTAIEIADQLEEAELIKSSSAFLWYLDREGLKAGLKAGTYRLWPGMSSYEVADYLHTGRVDTSRVTILPGLRIDQVEELLVNSNFDAAEVRAALKQRYRHALLTSKPASATLEGYIYPDTYEIDSQTTAAILLERTFDHFNGLIDSDIRAGLKKQGLTVNEGIILASIVQKESSNPATQKKIAQVFLRRLKIDMPLGADPTFLYAAAISGRPADTMIDSPYNTRINTGLPPGPISNFNISALEAVAAPAKGDFLYFVAGDDGTTYFSHTFEEHERLRQQYCHKACKLPQ